MRSGTVAALAPITSEYWRSTFFTTTSIAMSTFSMSSLSAMSVSSVPTSRPGTSRRTTSHRPGAASCSRRLVSSGGVTVRAGVPERYAGDIEVGTQVRIEPTAYEAEPRGGRVTFVGTAVDPQSRTFPIEIAVDNSDRQLKPDMVVRLQVAREVLEDAISVPQEAIIRDERGTSVFIAVTDAGGTTVVERRVVELGPDSGDQVVLLDGVEPGDRVIVSGQSGIAEGDRVRVTERERTAATRETASR